MSHKQEHHEKEAFIFWRRRFAQKILTFDEDISPFLNPQLESWQPNQKSWLAATRQALHLTSTFIASKLGVDRSALSHSERMEKEGHITINSLFKISEAMDCELILAIRPKSAKTFCETLWQRVLPEAKKGHAYSKSAHRADPDRARILGYAVQRYCYDRKIMRKLGLTRKKTLLDDPFIRR